MRLLGPAAGVSPRFLALLEQEGLAGKRVLDLGCGWGRLTLALAGTSALVVGLDRDAAAIRGARERAAAAGLANVEFHEADVERAGRALPLGGGLGIVAFHVDQWRETGRVSRFAYDAARMETTLRRAGLDPEAIEVEREVQHFASVEAGLAAAVGLEDRWKADGRWYRYIGFLEAGGRTLTRSHLIVKARKR